MQTSTRFGVSYPSPARTDPADAALHIGNVVTGLEKALRSDSGLAAARPVSSVGTPGIVGRMYYATDDGQMYYDYGTGWIAMYTANSALLKTTNASGSNYSYQSFVGAEPNPRYAVTARGQQEWGVGTTPADTNLYRRQADQLATDDWFAIRDRIEIFNWTGEANPNIRVIGNAADQRIEFGPGGAVSTDVNLYRNAVGQLKVTGVLRNSNWVLFQEGTNQVIIGEISPFLGGTARPGILFGSANDTTLYRAGAGLLHSDGSFRVGQSLVVDQASAGWRLYFGGAQDTSIYRAMANQLKTDGSIEATLGFSTASVAGISYGFVFRPAAYNAASRILTAVRQSADSQPHFYIDADGRLRWGPGGSSNEDVTLGRARAGVISMAGMLALGGTSGGGDIPHGLVFDHATASPTVIDNGGGILFVQNGVLKYRGAGNIQTVTVVG